MNGHTTMAITDPTNISDSPTPKRRKVRKGTQSCWECKRRKAKCSLSNPGPSRDDVCDGCRRRGSTCISQEFPDDPASHRQQLGDRIGRVEALMAKLAGGLESSRIGSVANAGVTGWGFTEGNSTIEQGDMFSLSWKGQLTDPQLELAQLAATNSSPHDKFSELSKALMTAWPSDADLEAIVSFQKGTAAVFHGLICVSWSFILDHPLPTSRELFEKPDPASHPTLIAHKLLMLSIFLQSFCGPEANTLMGNLSVHPREIMARAFETATRLVSCNDELIGTIEGVECIMMEVIYQNNAGYLRLALLAIRRALTTGQMIGLNRGPRSPLLRILDLKTRDRVKPDHMWFRIVQSDRYLSLQMGMPQGCIENAFAGPEDADCTDAEKLERGLTIAAGRIIQRNASGMHDPQLTQEVDELLLKGANSMSAQWWLCPDITSPCEDQLTVLKETNRFMTQIAHYSMLERLHLPFLLRRGMGNEYDYNKMTAVTASREVLKRFIVFRGAFSPSGTFCRGIDFFAFGACTVICLAYIDAQLNRESDRGQPSASSTVFNYLAHYRLSDRGMLERALTCFESVHDIAKDHISHKIYSCMKSLLAIEADLANGLAYKVDPQYRDNGETDDFGCAGQRDDSGKGLEVHIPHLGTIKIKPDSATSCLKPSPDLVEKAPTKEGALPEMPSAPLADPDLASQPFISPDMTVGFDPYPLDPWTVGYNGTYSFDFDPPPAFQGVVPNFYTGDEWALQGVDTAFFDGLFLQPYNS